MNDAELFIECVREATDLPAEVREQATTVVALRPMVCNDSLLSLLDAQLRMSSRGPEWAKRITQQKEALGPYCDKRLLKGRIQIGMDAYWIYVETESQSIVYWECYKNWAEQQ